MSLQSLAKQTLIYGASTIILRMASWMLTPYYSYAITQQANGQVAFFMSIVAFLNIIYMFGMETSYFRFIKSENQNQVFQKTESIVFFNSILWSLILVLFAKPLIAWLGYSDKEIYVYLLTLTLFFENLCNIPFAQLRQENKALKFVSFKALYIILNISLNLILLSYFYKNKIVLPVLNIHDPIELIFWANLIPWFLVFLYFSPQIFSSLSWSALKDGKEMLNYSWPLLLVGAAGMVNEVIDRPLLRNLLPGTQIDNEIQLGIYNINYKLAIIMTLAIQAFRMGAEPYFFKLAHEKSSTKMYAIVMDFFVIVCSIILVITSLNRDIIAMINNSTYKEGIQILPILLLANLFLGMYYNTSIWYKATNNTMKGAYISLVGAVITIALNWILIQKMGYMGSAWTTLICYFAMLVISLIWGRKYYPIPYHYAYNFLWIGLSTVYSLGAYFLFQENMWALIGLSFVYLFIACYFAYKRFGDIRGFL